MESQQNASAEFAPADNSMLQSAPSHNENHFEDFDLAAKEKSDRIFLNGMKWLVAGVFLLGSSFAVNFLLFDTQTSFVTVMYIMTTIGAVCVVKSLGDILGF